MSVAPLPRTDASGRRVRSPRLSRGLAVPLALALLHTAGAGVLAGQGTSDAPRVARISGTVFDSVGGRVLRGAVVQLASIRDVARARTSHSDSSGGFAFDSVELGTYLIGFAHPLLDSLGFEAPAARVDVRTGGEVRAPLATMSARSMVARSCKAGTAKDPTGLVLGRVRETSHGEPVAGATVLVQWREYTIGKGKIDQALPFVEVKTHEDGSYAICGVPAPGTIMVRASTDSASSGFVDLEVPTEGLLRRDMWIGRWSLQTVRAVDTARAAVVADSVAEGAAVAAAPRDSAMGANVQVLRGGGVLNGVVRGSNGLPIAGARLLVWGSGVSATTAADGSFSMRSLPAGSHTVDIRALGFLPTRQVLDIGDASLRSEALTMEPIATFLDTVKVQGSHSFYSQAMEGFERRRRSPLGYFLGVDDMKRLSPLYVADLFRTIPGVNVRPNDYSGYTVSMRGMASGASCSPAVFLDGVQQFETEGDLELLVALHDLRGVEVYPKGAVAPPQFRGSDSCGSIVFWSAGLKLRRGPAPTKGRR